MTRNFDPNALHYGPYVLSNADSRWILIWLYITEGRGFSLKELSSLTGKTEDEVQKAITHYTEMGVLEDGGYYPSETLATLIRAQLEFAKDLLKDFTNIRQQFNEFQRLEAES